MAEPLQREIMTTESEQFQEVRLEAGSRTAAPVRFHQPTRSLRERARRLGGRIVRGWPTWRPVGLATLMSLFMAASGAFGVRNISPELRYPLLAGIGFSLSLVGLGLTQAAGRIDALRSRPALGASVADLAGFAVATVVCWGLGRMFEGELTPPITAFAGPAALFMTTIVGLEWLTRSVAPPKRPAPAEGAPFVNRLPHKLRGATILAIHGEDHYVRVHTTLGEHLIWMRLSDALAELAGADGGQTHRSWWVAKTAVTGVRRGNGRAVLFLSNGLQAPVSRRFARRLREEGWL
jgi:hypothetical protein